MRKTLAAKERERASVLKEREAAEERVKQRDRDAVHRDRCDRLELFVQGWAPSDG